MNSIKAHWATGFGTTFFSSASATACAELGSPSEIRHMQDCRSEKCIKQIRGTVNPRINCIHLSIIIYHYLSIYIYILGTPFSDWFYISPFKEIQRIFFFALGKLHGFATCLHLRQHHHCGFTPLPKIAGNRPNAWTTWGPRRANSWGFLWRPIESS